MKIEIKGCPFCGNAPDFREMRYGLAFKFYHVISCPHCEIQLSHIEKEKVLSWWNTRVQTDKQQSPAEKSSNTQNNLSLGEKEKEKDGENKAVDEAVKRYENNGE